jgi:hypothetical protein
VILARDPKNRHDIEFNEYVKLMKEENDVTEEDMDGNYVKFD